ncbi:MAG TPA: segregation/condensation protein A [Candidatus Nanoarchaeia archaeon]|nr:segregation/condensation protein A [Candidatus Nanoarchaeia archaeon]
MHEKIIDLLLKEEEISWKTILYDMVKTGEIDPWDVNITILTQKYIEIIKKIKEHDLKVSGKVLLAAALLLKIKSVHLVDTDIARLDSLIHPIEDLEEWRDELYDSIASKRKNKESYTLIPRNPQPRNRKVSIHDLVNALQRAMISKKKVLEKMRPTKFAMPDKNMNIMEAIQEMLQKISYYSKKDEQLTFSRLLPPKAGRLEKVYTFIPLLHLEHQRKVEMRQDKAFDDIYISLQNNSK